MLAIEVQSGESKRIEEKIGWLWIGARFEDGDGIFNLEYEREKKEVEIKGGVH